MARLPSPVAVSELMRRCRQKHNRAARPPRVGKLDRENGLPHFLVYHIPCAMSEGSPRHSPGPRCPAADTGTTFRKEAYAALSGRSLRWTSTTTARDPARRAAAFGGARVSRTPIREAMTLLEQEGFVRTRPRRGIFVVRKTKREIVEMITVMAALESMAARLAAERAADNGHRRSAPADGRFRAGNGGERLAEYSDANIAFHQAIIRMSGCALLAEMTENLFIHMRAIRKITIHQDDRAARSIVDHLQDHRGARTPRRRARRAAGARTYPGARRACRAARRFSRYPLNSSPAG